MIYRLLRLFSKLAIHIFFRRVEVEAQAQVPLDGPVLFVANHSNALIDPLLLVTSLRRRVAITAKNTLKKNPIMRLLFASVGVITFHRGVDVTNGASPRQNVQSLKDCRQVLQRQGALCIFPEGVSHSGPKLREFRTGPARCALDYLRKNGNIGRLKIVPVGMLYTEKERYRSSVWLRYGEPLDVQLWKDANPDGGAVELTAELERRVTALTVNYQSRRESAILSWVADVMTTGIDEPAVLGSEEPLVAERFQLLNRLQAGYQTLLENDMATLDELTIAIRRYRAQLKRHAVRVDEVFLPIHFGRAALFVVREFELAFVGAPIALIGIINHAIPYWLVTLWARKMSTDRDHWASNIIFPSLLLFPLSYAIQLALAWCLLPTLWALVYTVALPFSGYYALLYANRLTQTWRRAATFLRFARRPERQQQLAEEGRQIVNRIRNLAPIEK